MTNRSKAFSASAFVYGDADIWGDGDGDGQVTLNEPKDFLEKEMTLAARRDHGRTQKVYVSGVSDFVLARFDPHDPPLRPLVGATDIDDAVAK
ncbi:MAG: hypothetical protein VW268_10995 [Rhodospirillaceae bacterium]